MHHWATSRQRPRSSCPLWPRGRLRNPDQLRRPRWPRGRQCTNIRSGPVSGGRSLSRSTSTTPAMSCTAISNYHCSTRITTNAVSCRSMSTTPREAALSPSSCGPARRRPASRCALICAGWCGIFESAGQKPVSCSGATGITRGPRRWRGVKRTDVDYVFNLSGTKPLSRKVDETADAIRTERALDDRDVVRGYAETRHRAKS